MKTPEILRKFHLQHTVYIIYKKENHKVKLLILACIWVWLFNPDSVKDGLAVDANISIILALRPATIPKSPTAAKAKLIKINS